MHECDLQCHIANCYTYYLKTVPEGIKPNTYQEWQTNWDIVLFDLDEVLFDL